MLPFLQSALYGAQDQLNWSTIAILGFIAAFLVVGALRVVEFKDAGLPRLVRRTLIAIHLAGCVLFASGLAMFELDPLQKHRDWTVSLFASGVLILFPLHIYLALKRRQKMRRLGMIK